MRHPHSVKLLIAAVLSSTLTLLTGMPGVTGVLSAARDTAGGSNEYPRRSYSRLDRRGD